MKENKFEKINDIAEKIDITPIIKKVIESSKSAYLKIMDGYCDWLDKKGISPNQVVTWRVVAGIASGLYLASWDNWTIWEVAGLSVLWISFIHDAVDWHLARRTNQTSTLWETLDALGDKIVVFTLLWILLLSDDINPILFSSIFWTSLTLLLQDIKSQYLRWNNIEALKACWKKPLTAEERENNPNSKSPNAAVSAGKIKTALIMSWTTWGYMQDVLEITDSNAIPLLISVLVSNIAAAISLKKKWVTLQNFIKSNNA